jgi:hypothetical protein
MAGVFSLDMYTVYWLALEYHNLPLPGFAAIQTSEGCNGPNHPAEENTFSSFNI